MFQDERGVGKLKTPSIASKCKMGDTISHFDVMEGWEWLRIPLSHRNTRWRGGAGHRSSLSCVLTQWGGWGWPKIPSVVSKHKMGVLMRRCPPSRTSMQWRGRNGQESPPSHQNMRREGWWVAETSPHSKCKRVGLVVDLCLMFRARERQGGFDVTRSLITLRWLETEGERVINIKYEY